MVPVTEIPVATRHAARTAVNEKPVVALIVARNAVNENPVRARSLPRTVAAVAVAAEAESSSSVGSTPLLLPRLERRETTTEDREARRAAAERAGFDGGGIEVGARAAASVVERRAERVRAARGCGGVLRGRAVKADADPGSARKAIPPPRRRRFDLCGSIMAGSVVGGRWCRVASCRVSGGEK
mmetsp:Transcript_59836/g.177317  ORF Transcript_59836/g.177317 Transcript_59836/m.177317 type:complete len:184 (-) Transcript_59836:354-905(-)